jgi:hypothetical protein
MNECGSVCGKLKDFDFATTISQNGFGTSKLSLFQKMAKTLDFLLLSFYIIEQS